MPSNPAGLEAMVYAKWHGPVMKHTIGHENVYCHTQHGRHVHALWPHRPDTPLMTHSRTNAKWSPRPGHDSRHADTPLHSTQCPKPNIHSHASTSHGSIPTVRFVLNQPLRESSINRAMGGTCTLIRPAMPSVRFCLSLRVHHCPCPAAPLTHPCQRASQGSLVRVALEAPMRRVHRPA